MSDVMLLGVLRMPPELWIGSPLDVKQRSSRYIEAAERIESDGRELERLRSELLAVGLHIYANLSPTGKVAVLTAVGITEAQLFAPTTPETQP